MIIRFICHMYIGFHMWSCWFSQILNNSLVCGFFLYVKHEAVKHPVEPLCWHLSPINVFWSLPITYFTAVRVLLNGSKLFMWFYMVHEMKWYERPFPIICPLLGEVVSHADLLQRQNLWGCGYDTLQQCLMSVMVSQITGNSTVRSIFCSS